ncbi:MAG TPA: hypothetical protein V6C72_05900 [Chroococcales cyanobacterium]
MAILFEMQSGQKKLFDTPNLRGACRLGRWIRQFAFVVLHRLIRENFMSCCIFNPQYVLRSRHAFRRNSLEKRLIGSNLSHFIKKRFAIAYKHYTDGSVCGRCNAYV